MTEVQVWECLQRSMSLSPPEERWSRWLRSLTKNALGVGKPGVCRTTLPVVVQAELLSILSGMRSPDPGVTYLSILMALQDLIRYSPAEFDRWFSRSGTDVLAKDAAQSGIFLHAVADHLPHLSFAQRLWLTCAEQAPLNWRLLCQDGPWKGESRAEFLREVMRTLDGCPERVTPDSVKQAEQLFSALQSIWRGRLPGYFLPQLVILVEGQTEAVLLPYLADLLNFDLNQNAVMVLACGGAKQVARRYLWLRESLSLPILALFDGDARQEASLVSSNSRSHDRIHVIETSEIEELFEPRVTTLAFNRYLRRMHVSHLVRLEEVESAVRRTDLLRQLCRQRGLNGFDKLLFASIMAELPLSGKFVPPDIRVVINSIRELLKESRRQEPC